MSDIFISYSSKDEYIAFAIGNAIEAQGLSCWLAGRDANAGKKFDAEVESAIRAAGVVLVIEPQSAKNAPNVFRELNLAVEHNKIIIPFEMDTPQWREDASHPDMMQWVGELSRPGSAFLRMVHAVIILLKKNNTKDMTPAMPEDYEKQANCEQLRQDTWEQRYSFAMSLKKSGEEELDRAHFYEKMVRYDVVDSRKGKWSSYRFLTITNDSENNTHYIVHKECGECKTEFSQMRIRARQGGAKGKPLIVHSQTEVQPNFVQVFRIYFDKPLQPGETIEIFYRLDWPGEPESYYQNRLSQSISLTRYAKGVGSLEFGVFEPNRIELPFLEEVDEWYRKKQSNYCPETLSIDDVESLVPLKGTGYNGICYKIDDVRSIGYRVLYRLNTSSEEDAEDFF